MERWERAVYFLSRYPMCNVLSIRPRFKIMPHPRDHVAVFQPWTARSQGHFMPAVASLAIA